MQEKGIICATARAFVVERFGEARWRDIVAGMAAEDAAAMQSMVATAWYDVGLVMRLFRRMVSEVGGGEEAFLATFARFQAERDLKVTYRLFFRFANPALVLEKAMSYWDRFHDAGRWVIERPSETSALGTLSEFPVEDALFCLHLTAYITRMFELVGARAVHTEHPRCRTRGDVTCVFASSWR